MHSLSLIGRWIGLLVCINNAICNILTPPSALGVFDGRVYEELWRRAQLEPLNQTEGTPGYEVSFVIVLVVLY
jgi:hypothetical protein